METSGVGAVVDGGREYAVAPKPKALVKRGKYSLADLGITFTGQLTFKEWDGIGAWLQAADKAIQWWIGDWMNYGEERFGEQYAQAIDATGWSISTVKQYQYVAERVPYGNRRATLSFFHHREVADLPPDQQVEWLDRAAGGDAESDEPWTVDRLRRELNAKKNGGVADVWVMVKAGSQQEAEELVAKFKAEGREAKLKG